MSKRTNIFFFHLLFVITALIQLGSTASMRSKLLCFGKKQRAPMIEVADNNKKTKIIDLPYDCLHEIFRFLVRPCRDTKSHIKKSHIKSLLVLRFVCKIFRKAVKSFPGPLSLKINCINRRKFSLNEVFTECKIETLELNNCNFEGTIIAWPRNLLHLVLYHCRELDEGLQALTQLQKLELSWCKEFTDLVLQGLKNLHSLKVKNCCKFTGSTLKELKNLHTLEVSGCSEFVGSTLKELTQLQKFMCEPSTFNIGELDFSMLKSLIRLQELQVKCWSSFNDSVLKSLKQLQKLEVFTCCNFNGSVLESLTRVHTLEVRNCPSFDGSTLEKLTQLQILGVYWCPNFTDSVLENLTQVRTLKVFDCSLFAGSTLKELTQLQILAVFWCPRFTDSVLEGLTQLQELKVRSLPKFTGLALQGLINLHILDVYECPGFTASALQGLTQLQKLKVCECYKFYKNSNAVKKLRRKGCKVAMYGCNYSRVEALKSCCLQ